MEQSNVSRQRKHQLDRRAQGFCAREGCPVKSGRAYYCPAHKAEHRAASRDRRRKAADAKLDAASHRPE